MHVVHHSVKRVCLILALLPLLVGATTYYVDSGCSASGTGPNAGTSQTCGGATGPFKTLAEGVAALSVQDDILNIRGVHSSHGTCAGTDGRFYGGGNYQGVLRVNGKNGASGHPIIIQAMGYTTVGAGTQEAVYLDGTQAPSWTQCTDCSAGSAQTSCRNMPGTCSNVYFASGNGAGQKADGTPTRSMNSAAEVTSQYDSLVIGSATVVVRWAFTPTASERTFLDNSQGINVDSSSYVDIKGFNVRCAEDAGVQTSDNAANIGFYDVTIRYVMGNPSGGDYGLFLNHGDPIVFQHGEIGYTGSEGVHTQPHLSDVATTFTLKDIWIHGFPDSTVMGTFYTNHGTPNGMTIATSGPTETGAGNYQGSVFSGLLIENGPGFGGGVTPLGINFEHHVDNLVVRDSIIHDVGSSCAYFQLDGGVSANGNQFFNNLLYNCCQTACQAGLNAHLDTGLTFNSNAIYNNTIVMGASVPALALYCNAGTCTNDLYRNNILYNPGSVSMVDVPNQGTHTGTVFEYNDAYSTYPFTIVSFEGTSVDCAGIAGVGAGNKCADPLFTNSGASNYHILTGSPAKDSGTSTGLPAGRTTDINNTIASVHGLPAYNDNQAASGTIDMGADEFTTASSSRRPMVVTGLRRAFSMPPVIGPVTLLSCP